MTRGVEIKGKERGGKEQKEIRRSDLLGRLLLSRLLEDLDEVGDSSRRNIRGGAALVVDVVRVAGLRFRGLGCEDRGAEGGHVYAFSFLNLNKLKS